MTQSMCITIDHLKWRMSLVAVASSLVLEYSIGDESLQQSTSRLLLRLRLRLLLRLLVLLLVLLRRNKVITRQSLAKKDLQTY